jgi:hypothetical protein
MKPHLTILVVGLLLAVTAITNLKTGLAEDYQLPEGAEFMEIVDISVNCTTANLLIICGVISNNVTLVHFPAGIDMNATELKNATEVTVGFSTEDSFLWIVFNNTEVGGAEKYANATVETYFEPVFGCSFTHNSTSVEDTYVNVTFTGNAVANLTEYTEWLMTECLASDLAGFSLAFTPITNETGAYTLVGAQKESGGFNWINAMGVMYPTTILTGTGSHTIDVLDLLNVESLAPSPYALVQTGMGPFYASIVDLKIYGTVSFLDCEPERVPYPGMRGWYIITETDMLEATFSFGGSPDPVSELWLSFTGEVVSEFTAPVLVVLTLSTCLVVAVRKRFIYQ